MVYTVCQLTNFPVRDQMLKKKNMMKNSFGKHVEYSQIYAVIYLFF